MKNIIDEFLSHNTDYKSGYENALWDLLDQYNGETIPKEAIRNLCHNLEEAEEEAQ